MRTNRYLGKKSIKREHYGADEGESKTIIAQSKTELKEKTPQ